MLKSFSVTLGEVVTTGQSVAQMTADNEVAPEEPATPPVPSDNTEDNQRARVEVRLPDIGDAGEVVVIELGVAAGDTVDAQQMLLVVESDKASMDIVSPTAGVGDRDAGGRGR